MNDDERALQSKLKGQIAKMGFTTLQAEYLAAIEVRNRRLVRRVDALERGLVDSEPSPPEDAGAGEME